MQRPWGRMVPGEGQLGGLGGCSRVSKGKKGRQKAGEAGRVFPQELYPTPGLAQAWDSAAPHLPLPALLVLLQTPDLLQQAALLLSQPHNLLVGILIILFSPSRRPTP